MKFLVAEFKGEWTDEGPQSKQTATPNSTTAKTSRDPFQKVPLRTKTSQFLCYSTENQNHSLDKKHLRE